MSRLAWAGTFTVPRQAREAHQVIRRRQDVRLRIPVHEGQGVAQPASKTLGKLSGILLQGQKQLESELLAALKQFSLAQTACRQLMEMRRRAPDGVHVRDEYVHVKRQEGLDETYLLASLHTRACLLSGQSRCRSARLVWEHRSCHVTNANVQLASLHACSTLLSQP